MNETQLRSEVMDYEDLFRAFEALLQARDKFFVADDRLATALCEMHALIGAYQVLAAVRLVHEFKSDPVREDHEIHSGTRGLLPRYETVQMAGRKLMGAIAANDTVAVEGALQEMQVLVLCPTFEDLLPKMEAVARRVSGHAQQVFLVELAQVAAKLGDYERASRCIQEARAFDPSSWELYNICMIEGQIALNTGAVHKAIQWLDQSIGACLEYERARAQCCVRAPSLELPKKLLELGERDVVVRHLLDCKNVWSILEPEIDDWIQTINNGDQPDFLTTGNLRIPERPSHRLRMQWMNASSLAKGPVSSDVKKVPPKSPAERLAARERWMVEHGPRLDAFVRRKLQYLEKDLPPPPPDQPA